VWGAKANLQALVGLLPSYTGCAVCNPGGKASATDECKCVENAFAEGLRRWQTACPCCFGDAHPDGVEAAVTAAMR